MTPFRLSATGGQAAQAPPAAPLFEAYLRFKRAEAKVVAGLSDEALCQRYREVY